MREYIEINIENPSIFKDKLLLWAKSFAIFAFFDSNNLNFNDKYSAFDWMLGAGVYKELCPSKKDNFEQLAKFSDNHQDWILGFLTYDLKNEVENLYSQNQDYIQMPILHFFVPEWLFILNQNILKIGFLQGNNPNIILKEINQITPLSIGNIVLKSVDIKTKITFSQYKSCVEQIINHIHKGDIYEANYCHEFFAENVELPPVNLYLSLSSNSPAPFSCYYRLKNNYLMCKSPERFLRKINQKIINQPIKGTIQRGYTAAEDNLLIQTLQASEKDLTENIMIVDLVRNDLSITAMRGSVKVEELCKIYSFKHLHQMISTISSILKPQIHLIECIKKCFPMGSMTGAPKLRAMQIIEQYETTKRGLYSGCVGYISPLKNFDFNVVIRSILYNSENKYISYMAGGAITAKSEVETEYDETLLKAKAIFKIFK